MVKKDNFSILSDVEKAKYEFKFCQHCLFYKCELISEYLQYRESHKPQRKNATAVKTIYVGDAKLAEQAQLSNNADELNEKMFCPIKQSVIIAMLEQLLIFNYPITIQQLVVSQTMRIYYHTIKTN